MPNRLAPPSQNALLTSVPTPYSASTLVPAPTRFNAMREAENLSIGLGRGFTAGLEGTKQLLTQPVATARALVDAARQVGADPSIILEMLRAARQKAMSGSLGLGELLGENITPGMRTRGPNMVRMGGPEDFMRRRGKQLIAEEDAEAKNLFQSMEQKQHRRNLKDLFGNKDWIAQTNSRANVVSKLHELGLPGLGVDPSPAINSFRQITQQIGEFDDPNQAYLALSNINYSKNNIDNDFDNYIASVREYRKALSPRSKYDRETIKQIDSILGDVRVTQFAAKIDTQESELTRRAKQFQEIKDAAMGKIYNKVDEETGDYIYPQNRSLVEARPNTFGNYTGDATLRRKIGDARVILDIGNDFENVVGDEDGFGKMHVYLSSKGDFPKGTGAATEMYLEALAIAQQKGLGFVSDAIRSQNAENIYKRLIKKGVPFKKGSLYEDTSWVLTSDEVSKLDLPAIAAKPYK